MLRRTIPKLIPLGIVLFWLVMMGAFLYREASITRLGRVSRTLSLLPSESWMGVYLPGDTRVGYVHTRLAPEERYGQPGARTEFTALFAARFLGEQTRMNIRGEAWRSAQGNLADFSMWLGANRQEFTIEGSLRNKRLKGHVTTADFSFPIDFEAREEILFSSALGPSMDLPPLEVGDEFEIDMFDAVTFSTGRARIRCVRQEDIQAAGKTVRANVVEVTASGATTTAWLGVDGELLRAQTPMGFILAKLTMDEALRPLDVSDAGGLLETAAVRPSGKAPFQGARRMVVRLSGHGVVGAPLSDATQRRLGPGIFEISCASLPGETARAAPGLAEFLRSDPLVQSTHERIVAQAREITAGHDTVWDRAQAIYAWIYETIEKRPVWSVPSALSVLATREGDCNEHTVLFTALARATGIPTRMAIGLVWSEEYKGFYYHAWPEVYVGHWIGMDPTLGQPIADATHVKLLNGGIEKWTQLYPYLGQLEIEVLEVE